MVIALSVTIFEACKKTKSTKADTADTFKTTSSKATSETSGTWVDSWAASFLSTKVNGAVQAAPSFNNQTFTTQCILETWWYAGPGEAHQQICNEHAYSWSSTYCTTFNKQFYYRFKRPGIDIWRKSWSYSCTGVQRYGVILLHLQLHSMSQLQSAFMFREVLSQQHFIRQDCTQVIFRRPETILQRQRFHWQASVIQLQRLLWYQVYRSGRQQQVKLL